MKKQEEHFCLVTRKRVVKYTVYLCIPKELDEIYRMAYRYVPVHKPLHILIRSDQSKIFTATLALIKT